MKTERERKLEGDLREAVETIRFLHNHLQGRMGDGALTDMRVKAESWEEKLAHEDAGGGDCPECGGRGLVSAVDWVEHYPVLAADPCPVCSAPAPPQQRDALEEVGPDNLTGEERANVREIADEYSRETIKLLGERGFSLDERCRGVLAANMRLLAECICSRQRTIWQMRLTIEQGIAKGVERHALTNPAVPEDNND